MLLFFVMALLLVVIVKYNELKNKLKAQEAIQLIIAHDLLSPLISLKYLIRIEKEKHLNGKSFHDDIFLNSIELSTIRFELLTRNLNDWWWNIRYSKTTLTPIQTIFDNTISDLASFVEMNTVSLKYDLKGNGLKQSKNGDVIQFILRNSITNVIKHSSATQILIEVDFDETKLYLKIFDNGNAMSKNLQQQINTFMMDPKKNSDFKGLGLYLIRFFLNKINGKYFVELAHKLNYSNVQTIENDF